MGLPEGKIIEVWPPEEAGEVLVAPLGRGTENNWRVAHQMRLVR